MNIAFRAGRRGAVKLKFINDGEGYEYTRRQVTKDIAEQLVTMAGAGLFWLMYSWLMGDDEEEDRPMITGTAAIDKKERELQFATAPPMSIRIGDQWMSYNGLEPLSVIMSTSVDIVNEVKKARDGKAWGEAFANAVATLARQAQDKTYMRTIGDIAAAYRDPERVFDIARNIAVGFVPNFIRSPLRESDPVIHESDFKFENVGEVERFTRNASGGRIDPNPPKRDLFGREIEKSEFPTQTTSALYRMLSPLKIYDMRGDVADQMFLMIRRYNEMHPNDEFHMTTPGNSISIPGDKARVKMNKDQYDRFLKDQGDLAIKIFSERLDIINLKNPGERDIALFKKVMEVARKHARDKMKVEILRERLEKNK